MRSWQSAFTLGLSADSGDTAGALYPSEVLSLRYNRLLEPLRLSMQLPFGRAQDWATKI